MEFVDDEEFCASAGELYSAIGSRKGATTLLKKRMLSSGQDQPLEGKRSR